MILNLFGVTEMAQAFTVTPLILKDRKGILQVSNLSERSIQIEIKVYPQRLVDGRLTAALNPLSSQEQDRIVQLRPAAARILSKSIRTVHYKIVNPQLSFYLCTTTARNFFLLRICSRWQGQS